MKETKTKSNGARRVVLILLILLSAATFEVFKRAQKHQQSKNTAQQKVDILSDTVARITDTSVLKPLK